ncbi:MAG: adenosylmethionine decarboxylase [Pseudonocardia sp.]
MPFAGRHVLAELREVDRAVLDDEAALRGVVRTALERAGATVLQVIAHRFAPHGVTVLALLAESHASLHTWPEHGSAFVDVFTCGDVTDPEKAVGLIAEGLGATAVRRDTVRRGTGAPVREPLSPGLTRIWDVEQVLWEGDTAFQHVLVARTAHGITLFCDDERQSSEAGQLVYHEALMVPALLLARRRDDVLIIGSGEGVAGQIAARAGARRVDHVDIDAECVRRCAQLLPYGYDVDELRRAEAGDGVVHVHYADGWEFLADRERDGRHYDLVVVDLPDERTDDGVPAQHNRLYGVEFLRRASSVLSDGGVVVGQAGCATLWRNETLLRSFQRLGEVFATVVQYGSDEHEWTFLAGSPTPLRDPVEQMVRGLATLPYRPVSLDADALRRGAVPPHAVRRR